MLGDAERIFAHQTWCRPGRSSQRGPIEPWLGLTVVSSTALIRERETSKTTKITTLRLAGLDSMKTKSCMDCFTQRRLVMSDSLLYMLSASWSGVRISRLLEGPTYFRVLVINAT